MPQYIRSIYLIINIIVKLATFHFLNFFAKNGLNSIIIEGPGAPNRLMVNPGVNQIYTGYLRTGK